MNFDDPIRWHKVRAGSEATRQGSIGEKWYTGLG
jgi:hypothetical protein